MHSVNLPVVHECETSPYIKGRGQIEMCENGMLNRISAP